MFQIWSWYYKNKIEVPMSSGGVSQNHRVWRGGVGEGVINEKIEGEKIQ